MWLEIVITSALVGGAYKLYQKYYPQFTIEKYELIIVDHENNIYPIYKWDFYLEDLFAYHFEEDQFMNLIYSNQLDSFLQDSYLKSIIIYNKTHKYVSFQYFIKQK